jgi:hypothetical protein
MNITQRYITFGLCSLTFMACHPSNFNAILNKKIFTTVQEKRELFHALGIEYTHEVTMDPALRRRLLQLEQTPQAQKMFESNEEFLSDMQTPRKNQHLAYIQDHSIADSMIIKKINPEVRYGAFASQKIKARAILGLYAGEIKYSSDVPATNHYSFHCNPLLPGSPQLDIDAEFKGNELRFINGSKQSPNCEACNFFIPGGEKRIIYQATQDIECGEQFLADLGDSFWATHPINQYQELSTKIISIHPILTQARNSAITPIRPQKTKNSEATFGAGLKKGFFNK